MKIILLILIFCSCAHLTKPSIIAHRGAPGYLPEHSLAGVAMAHAFNVDYIEADLVLTKDDQLVVLHDIHIDTTTNVAKVFPKRARKDGRFYAIDFKLIELKKLKLNERIDLKTGGKVFSKRYPHNSSPFQIPSFDEFVAVVKGLNISREKNIGIYPEIKNPEFHLKAGKDITKAVFQSLVKHDYNKKQASIYVQCFYPMSLMRLKDEFKAKFPMIQLIADNSWKESSVDYDDLKTEKGLKDIAPYVEGVGLYINHLYQLENNRPVKNDLVKRAHQLGLKVHVYTHRVDSLPKGFSSAKQLEHFLIKDIGVDGIFSDFSDRF